MTLEKFGLLRRRREFVGNESSFKKKNKLMGTDGDNYPR